MTMEMRRMAHLNLALEVKRIIEVELERDDFTFLLEQPDNETDIVLEKDYEAGVNYKMPVVVIDINETSSEPFEMGGGVIDVGEFIIDVICVNKPESMDVAEALIRNLLGEHNFYDFNRDGNVPDLNVAYDTATLPSTILTSWNTTEEDFIQSNLKLTNAVQPNFAKRYSSMIEGRIRYLRSFEKS